MKNFLTSLSPWFVRVKDFLFFKTNVINMPGHIERRRKNSWTVVVELGRDAEGRRKRLVRSVKGTKKDAEKELLRLLAECGQGYTPGSKILLSDFLEKWLQTSVSVSRSLNTIDRYRRAVRRHISPALGKIQLERLRPEHVQSFVADLSRKGLKPATIAQALAILRSALSCAIEWGLIPRNPAASVRTRTFLEPGREPPVLSPEEVRELLALFANHRDLPVVFFAVHTGMRRGEILALRWRDVDWNRSCCTASQALIVDRTRGKERLVFAETKTKKRRPIALGPGMLTFLRALRDRQEQARLADPDGYEDNGLVFCNPDGSPMHPGHLSDRFRSRLRGTKFEGLSFHDLRHVSASLLLAANVHPKVVQERLGHSGISTTLSVYSHLLPSIQDDAAKRIEEILFPEAGPGSRSVH